MPRERIEPLERHDDPRGALLKVHPAPVTGEVYVVTLRPGASRGHHLHPATSECFVAVAGRGGVLGVRDPASGRVTHHPLDGVRAHVPAGLGHAIFNPGPDLLVVVAMADRRYDPGDVVPCPVPPP